MKLDLKEWIAKVVGQTEFKTLLWTNSSTTTSFGPQTIQLDMTEYDAIEVNFRVWTGLNFYTDYFKADKGINTIAFALADYSGTSYSGGPGDMLARGFSFSNTGIIISSGAEAPTTGAWLAGRNHVLIPYKIYGIRYVGG